ncbi:MAG: ABC transporter ATP-binding protein [Acholeplasmatales bacterium]|nr:ABC transporter ATP-binding protein [Acholeplasmatales bacterium]
MAAPRGVKAKLTKENLKTLPKLIKYLFKYYKWQMILVFFLLTIVTVSTTAASIFLPIIINTISATDPVTKETTIFAFDVVKDQLTGIAIALGTLYVLGLIASLLYTQIMAFVGQGFLDKLRRDMFNKMESLPISYFDRTPHGDIMSRYTNDVDAIRQFVSQTLIQAYQALLTIIFVVFMMLYYSVWLALIAFVGVFVVTRIIKHIGGNSAKYFMKQQMTTGAVEGYIEEMMNGQKVVKVFNHEEESKAKFNELNDNLYNDAKNANYYGNILMPILNNFGNLLYILITIIGVVLFALNAWNLSIGRLFDSTYAYVGIATIVVFLGMTKQLTQTIANVSQQMSMIAMAMAGAARIFNLMEQTPELDEGYVTLVQMKEENGKLVETTERTHHWAWKYQHKSSDKLEYVELKGDILLDNVDFGYYEDKIVLHNIDIYAHPGQQIALVGATGAGKTTITNLINRFYDLADGKVRYDGININKIKKADLRKSLAIVLQETNLFTGTVMENIRYGRLDATDEEVIEASKIANAYDFITRLPDGFNTMLTHNGANLSQGQRQLIAIARAACADAPVMILDEATSSIDTRTEALVQAGMDKLMEGRTVFVIAHRLSTVRNSDCIMVLDKGRIIERGTHDDLLAKKGTYYQLYTGAFELE